MPRVALALGIILSSVVCFAAHAAYIRSATPSEGKEVIFLDGKIEAGCRLDRTLRLLCLILLRELRLTRQITVR